MRGGKQPNTSGPKQPNNKRQCGVIVNDERARVELAGVVDFVNQVTSERDNLKAKCEESDRKAEALQAKVDELEENVSTHEVDLERMAVLQRDSAYFEEAYNKTKLERDDFEMTCRGLNEKQKALVTSVDRCKMDLDKVNEYLGEKDAYIMNLQHNLSKLKQDLKLNKDNVTRQQKIIRDLEQELEIQRNTVSESNAEIERLKGQVAQADAEVMRVTAASTTEINDLKSRIAFLESSAAEKQRETKVVDDRMKEIESFFNDAYATDNQGTGVLLTSGKMLSLENIAKLWIKASGFDGNPNFSIFCHASRVMANVIHSPAVCNFVSNLSKNTSLDTNLVFYFKYSEQPVSADAPIVWKVYNQYDQLSLIAKMIFVFKSNENTSNFQVILSQNHIVTAVCSKSGSTANVNISLTVMSRTGSPSTHHIEFVDPVNLDYDEPTLFPTTFTITSTAR